VDFATAKPLLMVDIDGVVSLFGPGALDSATRSPGAQATAAPRAPDGVEGSFHSIDGIPHFLSATAAGHLLELAGRFEHVWASGWEEKAEEYLPHLLGLPAGLPFVRFSELSRTGRTTHAHWKLEAIGAYAGDRPLAWVDDAFNDACHAWARERHASTLLVATEPQRGLTSREAAVLVRWAQQLGG
jgi:hypothetical protein